MAHPWAILTKSCIRCWSMSVAVVYVINYFELSDLVNMVCFWNRDSICYRTRALTTYGLAAAILDFRYEIMSVGYKDGRRTNRHSLKPNIWRMSRAPIHDTIWALHGYYRFRRPPSWFWCRSPSIEVCWQWRIIVVVMHVCEKIAWVFLLSPFIYLTWLICYSVCAILAAILNVGSRMSICLQQTTLKWFQHACQILHLYATSLYSVLDVFSLQVILTRGDIRDYVNTSEG